MSMTSDFLVSAALKSTCNQHNDRQVNVHCTSTDVQINGISLIIWLQLDVMKLQKQASYKANVKPSANAMGTIKKISIHPNVWLYNSAAHVLKWPMGSSNLSYNRLFGAFISCYKNVRTKNSSKQKLPFTRTSTAFLPSCIIAND